MMPKFVKRATGKEVELISFVIILFSVLLLTGCSNTDPVSASPPSPTPMISPDTDGDGIPDEDDPFPEDKNAPKLDRDGDGKLDAQDYAPDDPNIQVAPDSDGDGFRDPVDFYPGDPKRWAEPPFGATDTFGDAFDNKVFTEPSQIWCQRAFIFSAEGLDEILALADDPSGGSVDWETVRWIAQEFKVLSGEAPDSTLAGYADTHQRVLGDMLYSWDNKVNITISTGDYGDASAAQTISCGRYMQ